MLGTLAKWLRFMGYDTAYPGPLDDSALIDAAKVEGRILLTRDKELAARCPGAVRVHSDVLEEQVREVATVLGLTLLDPLSRCSVCNAVLAPIRLEDVKDLIPEGVRSRRQEFWQCPGCRKVYWRGTHWDKMVERLNHFDLPKTQ
jgi:uncharacterized protein with PIN domain